MSVDVRVSIVDDNINERFEQIFLIALEVSSAVGAFNIDNTRRNVTLVFIVDNDGECNNYFVRLYIYSYKETKQTSSL